MSIAQTTRQPPPIGMIVMLGLGVLPYAGMMACLGDIQSSDAMGRGFAEAFGLLYGLALWIVLAVLLLIGAVKGAMPAWSAIAAAIFWPLSGVAAVTAMEYLDQRGDPSYMLVPALIPPVIASYALWARMPALHRALPPLPTGIIAWLLVALLTIAPLPRYFSDRAQTADRASRERVEAEQAIAKAEERHRRELERFQMLTADSPLWDWAQFFGKDSDFDREAIAGANKLPHLQANAEEALRRGMGFPLVEYERLDIAATPGFCTAAGDFLTKDANGHRAPSGDADYMTVQPSFAGYEGAIEWLTLKNCDLDGAVARIREAVGGYKQSSSRDAYLGVLAWRRGNGFVRRGDQDRALVEYDAALRAEPDNAQFFASRGDVHYDKGEYDQAIADYDSAIRLNPGYSAAYNDRGNAYAATGDDNRALQDYDTAIEKNSRFAIAYNNRADVFVHQGNLPKAIADFDKALEIAPKYRVALAGRGRANYFAGSYAGAEADLAKSLTLKPDEPYTVLWLYLARGRAGQDAREALVADAARLDRAAWPYPIVAALIGETGQQAVFDSAGSRDNPDRAGQLCEADFYFGAKAAGDGNAPVARSLLRQAAAICPASFIEATGARYELALLP